jgi:hypothetical protein
MRTAKRPQAAQEINRLQKACFSPAVGPDEYLVSRLQCECQFGVAPERMKAQKPHDGMSIRFPGSAVKKKRRVKTSGWSS